MNLFSINENYYRITFLYKRTVNLKLLKRYQHFLDHHIHSHYIKFFLIIGFFPFHKSSVCILIKKLIVVAAISVAKARWINFEIAYDLKTSCVFFCFENWWSFSRYKETFSRLKEKLVFIILVIEDTKNFKRGWILSI